MALMPRCFKGPCRQPQAAYLILRSVSVSFCFKKRSFQDSAFWFLVEMTSCLRQRDPNRQAKGKMTETENRERLKKTK